MTDQLSEAFQFDPSNISGYISSNKLEDILEEIAGYEIQLPDDPTLPELGTKLLNSNIAKCRNYINRVQYYLQITRRYEKNLRTEISFSTLDLEFKTQKLLADDPIVKQGPAQQDRLAIAAMKLNLEHKKLHVLKVEHVNVEETIKIIKLKYDDLNRTSQDIRLQRQIVKDDKESWSNGGEGYMPPQTNRDGTIPGGMSPHVREKIVNPTDLLDESKRPEDLPVPVDAVHAQQIADFFNQAPISDISTAQSEIIRSTEPALDLENIPKIASQSVMSYDDLLAD
jgi:hypothetical protein